TSCVRLGAARAITCCAQTCAGKTGRALAVLHSTDPDRTSLQNTEGRSVDSPNLSSERQPVGGAHLCRFPSLLPSSHLAAAAERAGAGLDPSRGADGVSESADGGCASADHRRKTADPVTLHQPNQAPIAHFRNS